MSIWRRSSWKVSRGTIRPRPMPSAPFSSWTHIAITAFSKRGSPMPGIVERADDIKAKGVDEIACVAVNDAFVMQAWGESAGVADKVTMLADGNGDFAQAIGLTMDGSNFGLGQRGSRWSAVVNDGVVEQLNVEEPGAFNVSSADYMIERL